MSKYYNKTYFVYCTREEANKFKDEVEKLNNFYKGKEDFCYYVKDYDDVKKGIEIGYSKRNCQEDDFRYLVWKYKRYYIVYGDEDKSYTNDYKHEIFPKYMIDGNDFKNVDEIIEHYREEANWNDEEVKEFKLDYESLRDYLRYVLGVDVEEVYDD